jgi:predicted nucleic acid-binding protein
LSSNNINILADTTVWIEYLRGNTQTDLLADLIAEGRIWACGPVLFELLQGVRSQKQKEAVSSALEGLEYAEMTR